MINEKELRLVLNKTIRKNKPKYRVWNEEIANKLKESKHAYWKWKDADRRRIIFPPKKQSQKTSEKIVQN